MRFNRRYSILGSSSICFILGFNEGFWIGGTNLGNEPHFYWMGYKKPINFTDWLEGQPDNWRDNENCMEIWTDNGFKWNDRKCSDLSNFICEQMHVDFDVGSNI